MVGLRLTAGKAVRSGALWGYVFGAFVASSAWSYTTIYKTRAERSRLAAAFGSNHATSALFGPAPQLQSVAGFTVFKTFMTLSILGAVWGLLASTRLLRGEEDAGRWEVVLTGPTTRRGGTAQALTGLAAGAATLWAVTALVTVVVGRWARVGIAAGPGLFFALALVSSAVMFLAVGALTSQLATSRRQAASAAAVVLGVSYALRMVADSGIGLHWLCWVSPLGWVEELQPLTAPRPVALLPIIGFAAITSLASVYLAGTRDLGAGVLADRSHPRPHLRLLSGPLGLTIRLVRTAAVGWGVAIAATGLLLGLVAKAAGGTISGSSVQQVFTRLGATGTGAEAYLGVSFLVLAVLVAFVAAGQVTAARSEEDTGRLDHLLVRSVTRSRWFSGRWLMAVVVVVAGGLTGGVFTWLGAASQHAGVGLPTVLDAGVNTVFPALIILGVGALALGFWPRATSIAVYGVLSWSLLIELVGGVGADDHWVLDTSLFHQMASAPAVSPDWRTNVVLAIVGVAGVIAGIGAFRRRDLYVG